MSNDKKRGLGRGLDALIPTGPAVVPVSAPPSAPPQEKWAFKCAIEKITPMVGQPRRHFAKAALEELAQSIREHGIIEPLVVRRAVNGADTFVLVAGERRWRAAQIAGLHEVPVVVRASSEKDAFEAALVENAQREDLSAVEFAEACQRLLAEYSYTQEALATRLGKDRSTIANALRLLKLPARVRDHVVEGRLTEGHARALLMAKDDATIERLADKCIAEKLSVRAAEVLAKIGDGPKKERDPGLEAIEKTAAVRDLELRLTRTLGTKVEVKPKTATKGAVSIPYEDLDALDRLLQKLGVDQG
jgi:ParB family chromosome partitioning protein